MRLLAATAIAVAVSATPALAATPESGEVSETKLVQRWSGEAYGQPFKAPQLQNETFCFAPFCDAFTLDVKSAGDLTLRLNAPGSASYVDMEVTLPDGTIDFYDGNDADTFQQATYEDAPLGAWTVRIWPNELLGLYDGQYDGRATLVLPKEDEAPAAG